MSLQEYEILSELGKGAYSTVYQVKRLRDSKIYALKQVKISSLKDKEKRNALNEVRFLASIKNPNVISYKEAFFDQTEQFLCLITEFADGGDLLQKIQTHQKKGTYMSENFLWTLLAQLAFGLKALHDLKIVHRDLKSANVFLTKDGKVKLGDMNVSIVSQNSLEHTQTGTPYYASPEVWQDLPYDSKSDLWSLGCVIYEAACLKPPFRADDMPGLFKRVVKGEYPPLPRTYSKDLHQVVGSLLVVNPNLRQTCGQILNIPEVRSRVQADLEKDSQSSLLKTINFSFKGKNLAELLPKSNFEEENHLKNGKSLNFPNMKKTPKVRESSESFLREEGKNRERSLENLGRYKKIISNDCFAGLRLPRVKYQNRGMKSLVQKTSKDLTIGNRVNSDNLKVKPNTNRSLVAKRSHFLI